MLLLPLITRSVAAAVRAACCIEADADVYKTNCVFGLSLPRILEGVCFRWGRGYLPSFSKTVRMIFFVTTVSLSFIPCSSAQVSAKL
uniref:Putative secreted protein n=1 Tax=Anopheles marajoara TaxID=58244 RepID=A0A2M4CAD6_9DIPT